MYGHMLMPTPRKAIGARSFRRDEPELQNEAIGGGRHSGQNVTVFVPEQQGRSDSRTLARDWMTVGIRTGDVGQDTLRASVGNAEHTDAW